MSKFPGQMPSAFQKLEEASRLLNESLDVLTDAAFCAATEATMSIEDAVMGWGSASPEDIRKLLLDGRKKLNKALEHLKR